MAVAFVNKTSGTSTNTGVTTQTMTEPSGATQGDILIACMIMTSDGTNVVAPSGWTQLYTRDNASDDTPYRVRVWSIRRGASTPSDWSWEWTSGNSYREWMVLCYSGCKGTGNDDFYNAFPTPATGTSDTTPNPDPPSITTSVANCVNLIMAEGWEGAATGGWTPPTGGNYTERHDAGAGGSWSAYDRLLSSATTENCPEVTNTATGTAGWEALAIALEPAEAASSNAPRAAYYQQMLRRR